MKTYTKRDFHNPEQLTRQQVGAEYRLLLPEEVDQRFSGTVNLIDDVGVWHIATFAGNPNYTYRAPLETPLPDGTILQSNECCFTEEPFPETKMPDWGDVIDNLGFIGAGLGAAKKPSCYLAGPMSSRPADFNFPAFFSAAEFMEGQGFNAINPTQLDIDSGHSLEQLKQLTPEEFQVFLKGAMERDLAAVQRCDALVLLPGWENSKGAKAERAVAEWAGKRIGYLHRNTMGCAGWVLFWEGEIGEVGVSGETGPVDTGYPDHIKYPGLEGCLPGGDGMLYKVKEGMPRFFFENGEWKECGTGDAHLGKVNPEYTNASDNEGWVAHTPGEILPCCADNEASIELKFSNGNEGVYGPHWNCIPRIISGEGIIAWRQQPKLIKQPDPDGWIPHVPGDPMPCDGDAVIDVQFTTGDVSHDHEAYIWKDGFWDNWTGIDCPDSDQIIAWRPHQKQPPPYNSDERAEWDVEKPKFHPNDPKGAAGALKAPMNLLPPDALIEIAKVMGEGAKKYQPWNFIEANVCASTYIGAIGRHWAAYAKGVDIDPDSGLLNLAHLAANACILMTAASKGTLQDDRPNLSPL